MRKGVLIFALLLAVLVHQDRSARATIFYEDWVDWHNLGQIEWKVTGPGQIQYKVTPFTSSWLVASLMDANEVIGTQGIAGRYNSRSTAGVTISDFTTTGCSAVTIEFALSVITPQSQCPQGGVGPGYCLGMNQSSEKVIARTVSTCNGSNANYFTSAWFGTGGTAPAKIADGDLPYGGGYWVPTAATQCFSYQIGAIDDFGQWVDSSCYRVAYTSP